MTSDMLESNSISADGLAMAEAYLEHIGVKRRSGRYKFGSGERPYQGLSKGQIRKIKKGKDPYIKPQKPKSISEMTDDELQAAINRLRLEQTLQQMMPKEPTPAPKEHKFRDWSFKVGKGILEKSVDNIGTQGLTYALGTAINKAVNKRDEHGRLIEIVNPRKGQGSEKKDK